MPKKITKHLQKGNDVNDLRHVDLQLSHLKPLSAQCIVDAHAAVKADRKLISKFDKAGIADTLSYEFK